MTEESKHKAGRFRHPHLNIIVSLVIAIVYILSLESFLRSVLGWFFLFLPGYALAKIVVKNWKNNFVAAVSSLIVFSLSIDPLLGNIVQAVTFLNPSSILIAQLAFSLPLLTVSNIRGTSSSENSVKQGKHASDIKLKVFLFRNAAFFGAIAIAFGLYIQASLGAVAPRGMDIYGHMNIVNDIVRSGKGAFRPDLNVVTNFYHFLYAEAVALTGLDVLQAGLVAQVLLGVSLSITVFYFAEYVSGSSLASFFSAVLFIAGPPLYSEVTRYFYYFHPMLVALAILPFALVCIHKGISQAEEGNSGAGSLVVLALFLYHLSVGFMFAAILLVDSIFLLRSRWKLLLTRLTKIAALSFLTSALITIPFLFNISNPFKYVYTTGGFETIRSMLFGLSTYAFTSPLVGWDFLQRNVQQFVTNILPLLIVGIPALVISFRTKETRTASTLLLSSVLVGVVGIMQPYLGVAFMPQRFIEPLLIFGAAAAGLLLSYVLAVPVVRFAREANVVRIRLGISKRKPRRSVLIGMLLCSLVLGTYLVFFSPSQQAVLSADLYLASEDLEVIRWIDSNVPRYSPVLMDQYLQLFFAGVTGRPRLYSITAERPLYQVWDVYPVSVYIGETDPLEVDVEYIVISRWCYTTWSFVGKQFFDQHSSLTLIYEKGQYAVYEVVP